MSSLDLGSPTSRASGPTSLQSPPPPRVLGKSVLFPQPLASALGTLKGEGPGRGGEKPRIRGKAGPGLNPRPADLWPTAIYLISDSVSPSVKWELCHPLTVGVKYAPGGDRLSMPLTGATVEPGGFGDALSAVVLLVTGQFQKHGLN